MKEKTNLLSKSTNRRAFLKNGTVVAGATVGAGLLSGGAAALAQEAGGAPVTGG